MKNAGVENLDRARIVCDTIDATFAWSAKDAKTHGGTDLGAELAEILTRPELVVGPWAEFNQLVR